MINTGKFPIVILGGGPTGLGAAYMLTKWGCSDWVLYERDDATGGLSRSYSDDHGFTWDLGGHVTFSHYGFFTSLLDGLLNTEEWLHHYRESWIRISKTWAPYPFQNNIHYLEPANCAECLDGLIKSAMSTAAPPENFDEFLERTFGEGISRLFMKPYNSKVWAYPLKDMGFSWIGERVSLPDPNRVARNVALKTDDVSWGPNNKFRFPRNGGTGRIWERLTEQLPQEQMVTGAEAVELDATHRIVRFSNGQERHFGTLISTIPLDQLARISRNAHWIETASKLIHSSVHVIGVALKGSPSEELRKKCWMYFPESVAPFYRATHFSLYSPNNVRDIRTHWSLMCEISESDHKKVDPSNVIAETIQGMEASGLIESTSDVSHTWHRRVEYAYPTPTLTRDQRINQLLPDLMKSNIFSRGRFGAWLYEVGNMDHSFMQGFEAAAHVFLGTPEFTVWNPGVVNQPHPVLGWDRFGWTNLDQQT